MGEAWGSSVRFNRTETIAAVELWVSDLNVELHTRLDAREINTLFVRPLSAPLAQKERAGRKKLYAQAPPTDVDAVHIES